MTDRGLMKRYLLGMASPQERIALEDQYVSSPETFEELVSIENDLIDCYTHGKLSEFEKSEFEKRYSVSAKGRARLGFSRDLAEVVAEVRPPDPRQKFALRDFVASFRSSTPGFRWVVAAACALALLLAIVPLRLTRSRDLQARSGSPALEKTVTGRSQGLHSSPPSAQNHGVEGAEMAKAEPPTMAEFTLHLEGGVSRAVGSGASNTFVVPSGTSWLNLQLSLEGGGEPSSYVAVVETVEGSEIARIENVKSELLSGVKAVTVRLPIRLVPSGDYIVDLKTQAGNRNTGESIELYSFRIIYK